MFDGMLEILACHHRASVRPIKGGHHVICFSSRETVTRIKPNSVFGRSLTMGTSAWNKTFTTAAIIAAIAGPICVIVLLWSFSD